MTHRDRADDPPGRRGAAGDVGHRQGFPTPSGGSPARPEAASQGFRTASRMACDAPHRRTMRSWQKTLGSRLYESLSALLGIMPSMTAFATPPATLGRTAFVARFGGVYEHSPWIAEAAFEAGLTAAANSAEGLSELLRAQVEAGGAERQMALLRAHPDLAGKLAVADELTAASAAEQQGAGLAACTAEEFERFQRLNAAYREKFGFPFILAVAGHRRSEILEIFQGRLGNDRDTEIREALEQVHRIALLRLRVL